MNFTNLINLKNLVFIVVIIVAIVLRFWQLGNVPPSPDWDEASLGYNAYSIMTTGRDEYGEILPVILRSFDDYKPGLYAYLIIPFIKLFGLNIMTVRLPSAIFGVLAVIGTYFLVKELFPNAKKLKVLSFEFSVAELATFLIAVSPWHLQFSRIAFEAQVGLSLNIFSILFFLKGLKKGWYLIPSVILASTSIYIYQSEKVYLPVLFFVLVLIYWKNVISVPKKAIISAILLGAVLCIPMLLALLGNQNALMRARGVSVFSDQTQFLKRNVVKYAEDVSRGDLVGLVVDNRRLEYAKAIISGYIAHFNLNWLFITGDIERHHAPNMGLLYLFELPFLLMGIYQLAFGKFSKKTKLIIFSIFLIAPIPASVTSGVPHAVRTINFLPTFQIFIALGIIAAMSTISNIKYQISNFKLKYLIFTLSIIFFIFNFLYYLNQYFVQQSYYHSESWQYGWKEAVDYVTPIKDKYNKVVVTNDRPLDQSYVFFLFYLKYDPDKYLREEGTRTGGFKEEHKFDKFEFRTIDWNKEKAGNLYIGRPEDFPGDINVLKTVRYLDGKPAIEIVER